MEIAMNVILYVLLGLTLLLMILSAVFKRKEVQNMTIEKFKEKCDTLIKRKDGIALANFLKRHLVFCMTHAKEVEPYLKGISGCAPAVQNENSEKEV